MRSRSCDGLRFYARPALTFQSLMQLATFALLGPLTAWAIRRLVLLSGEPVVTNLDIPAFVLSDSAMVSSPIRRGSPAMRIRSRSCSTTTSPSCVR